MQRGATNLCREADDGRHQCRRCPIRRVPWRCRSRPPAPTRSGRPRARSAALEGQIEAGAAQIHQLTLAYEQANLDATTLGPAGQRRSGPDQPSCRAQVVEQPERPAATEAMLSYTGGAGIGPRRAQRHDGSVHAGRVPAGGYRRHQRHRRPVPHPAAPAATRPKATWLVRSRSSQAAAARAAAGAGQQALAQAAAEQAQLDQLQGQLSQYVEAAAVAAAGERATGRGRSGARRRTTQGLPVNNGLVTVVRTIVKPPRRSRPRPHPCPGLRLPRPIGAPPPPPPAIPTAPAPSAARRPRRIHRCRRGVAAASRVRVERQLRREHRQRVLRRLPVQRADVDRPRVSRASRSRVPQMQDAGRHEAASRERLGAMAGLCGRPRPA